MAPKKEAKKYTIQQRHAYRGPAKRPYRFRPGTVVLEEIRRYQKTADLLLPKRPFQDVCREIVQDYMTDLSFTNQSLEALQEAAEAYVVEVLRESNGVAAHAGRQTIKPEDVKYIVGLIERLAKKE
ncbi:unnamed protein product [Caenorhabditis sp. 36 PRJEB53466]|nr:unnamed protein product [Caenorhabditis sp. 36 PRJEB53466]